MSSGLSLTVMLPIALASWLHLHFNVWKVLCGWHRVRFFCYGLQSSKGYYSTLETQVYDNVFVYAQRGSAQW